MIAYINSIRKKLYINNVDNLSLVCSNADKLISKNIIDEYIIVDQYAEEALKFFEIDIDSFNGGYYYSISELVSIYLDKSDYLVHFSSDSDMVTKYDWISDSIKLMRENNKIAVTNPKWNINWNYIDSYFEDNLFYYQNGTFSDQCYMIKLEEFKNKIYNEYHISSNAYPPYGGELFEKRVNSYLMNNERIRATSKNAVYDHKKIIDNG